MTAAAIVAVLGADAHALVLCQQKKGQVVARDACRKKEKPVDLAALAPLGPGGAPGAAGAAGAPGAFPVRLVDSAGIELGTILQFFPTEALVEVSRPILGSQRVVFVVEPNDFEHNTSGAITSVFYGSSDCSGVPLIEDPFGTVFAQVYGDSAYFSTEPQLSRS